MNASGPVRVGNCSGFYGDRLSAMREMLEGSDLDYLTGDYLAELTMLILGKDTFKDPDLGYARTYVKQVEECLGLALERGVKLVSNAGGLNPAGLATRLREVAAGLGLDARIAHVEGDDLRGKVAFPSEYGDPLTANAYLGGFGIAAALADGADVVVTGRVTDASVVVGPAVHAFGWTPTSYDELAAAVVAGHVIECGTQATGGNFSGFLTLPDRDRPLGFPIAEISPDGSTVITKNAGTGGAVSVDTVTAQLLYEIQTTQYLNPDVTVDLSSIRLAQQGHDRVWITGVRGSAPPEQLKVCLNYLGGFRNGAEFVITGLDAQAKASWIQEQIGRALTARPPERLEWSQTILPPADAPTEEAGSVLLRVSVFDKEPGPVGKGFTAPIIELALASYPGLALTRPPAPGTPYGIYRPAYVDRSLVEHTVVHADGRREVISDPGGLDARRSSPTGPGLDTRRSSLPEPGLDTRRSSLAAHSTNEVGGRVASASERIETRIETRIDAKRLPLGTFVYARSGDKGGDANIGLWVRNDASADSAGEGLHAERVAWLLATMTPATIRELMPEAAGLEIETYALPNLGGLNILVRGVLGAGVAATSRFDPQAKALGEWLRSRYVDIPEELC